MTWTGTVCAKAVTKSNLFSEIPYTRTKVGCKFLLLRFGRNRFWPIPNQFFVTFFIRCVPNSITIILRSIPCARCLVVAHDATGSAYLLLYGD